VTSTAHEDLVIGVPFEQSSANGGGLVHLVPGGSAGLRSENARTLSQDSKDIMGTAEAGDQFGRSLAAGDFNEDGRADLAVGVPGEDIDGVADAGLVHVLYGSRGGGPSTTDFQTWHQNTADIPEDNEEGDRFGYTLSAWDYDGSSRADLAIGIPFEGVGSNEDAGAIVVIYSNIAGPSTTGTSADLWHQTVAGINDTAQPGDRFGLTLY
jgi:hypothetical protein